MQNDKIKVIRIIARLNIGGPAINATLLNEELDRRGFETYLVAGKPDPYEGDMSYIARERGLNMEYIPELGRDIGFRDVAAFIRILRFIKKIKPDIVHTHTAKAGALGRAAAFIAGVPVRIHTFHGHVLEGYFGGFKEKLFILIEKVLARFTTAIITVSESVRGEIVDKFHITSKDKCFVVKLGFDLDRFIDNTAPRGGFRNKIGVGREAILIGMVGRLVPIKNHKIFLEAAKMLIERSPGKNIKFVIVGDGLLRKYLTALSISMGLGGSVIFTGWEKDVASVYADLDIAALSSLNEGTPVSLIEAMASAKPVVSTDVGGVRDVVMDGECGLLSHSGNARDLSDKLMELVNDSSKRERFGIRGRELARIGYSKDRLIKEIEDLYRKCLVRR